MKVERPGFYNVDFFDTGIPGREFGCSYRAHACFADGSLGTGSHDATTFHATEYEREICLVNLALRNQLSQVISDRDYYKRFYDKAQEQKRLRRERRRAAATIPPAGRFINGPTL